MSRRSSLRWRVRAALIAAPAALVLALPAGAQAAIGGRLFATGGTVDIVVQPATSSITSVLFLLHPDGTRQDIALNTDVGRQVTLGPFAAGQELVFGIQLPAGTTFLMGPGSRNPDDIPHAEVTDAGAGAFRVGFEDLLDGGDRDYDDSVFRFVGNLDHRRDRRSPAAARRRRPSRRPPRRRPPPRSRAWRRCRSARRAGCCPACCASSTASGTRAAAERSSGRVTGGRARRCAAGSAGRPAAIAMRARRRCGGTGPIRSPSSSPRRSAERAGRPRAPDRQAGGRRAARRGSAADLTAKATPARCPSSRGWDRTGPVGGGRGGRRGAGRGCRSGRAGRRWWPGSCARPPRLPRSWVSQSMRRAVMRLQASTCCRAWGSRAARAAWRW